MFEKDTKLLRTVSFQLLPELLKKLLLEKLKKVLFQQNNNIIHNLIFIKEKLLESIKFNL